MFSIIMPVYNNEKYFPLAVQSILEQDYTNFELIIIDDGSTDRTPEIADKMAVQDKRIHVIHQKNQWIYTSFNNGIKKAKGEYIYIVNSDDKLASGALSLMARKVEQYSPDIIWTKVLVHVCDADQNILIYDEFSYGHRTTEERFYSNKTEVEKAWPFFISSRLAQNQANLYRREIMQSQPFRSDVYGADTLYNIGIADKINSALVLAEPVYLHFIYDNEVMNASVGKYYPYSHMMFNEIYTGYQRLFERWRLPQEEYMDVICRKRMTGLTKELRELQAFNCPLSTEEKLQLAFSGCMDEIIRECVAKSHREEELESRILSAVRELLVKEPISKDNKMYFAYELLDSLLRYEKDEEDFKKMEHAISHPLNPMHIGQIFYEKLLERREHDRTERTAPDNV